MSMPTSLHHLPRRTPLHHLPLRRQVRGFSLVELLVAMVISLVVVAAIGTIVFQGEDHKRKLTSANDLGQSGNFVLAQLDSVIRSAGSGFVQGKRDGLLGCRITAGTALPRARAWPEPFENFPRGNQVLAPVLIGQGQASNGSDILMVMRGNASAGDVPRKQIGTSPLGTTWMLGTALGFAASSASDAPPTLVLAQTPGNNNCLMQQVARTVGSTVELVGTPDGPDGSRFYTPVSADSTTTLASMTQNIDSTLTVLGHMGNDNLHPNVQFYLYGADPASTSLLRYDMLELQGADNASLVMADNVVGLYALYGIADAGTGDFHGWVAPNGSYSLGAIVSAPARLEEIVAIRLAVVLRSAIESKDPVTQEKLTLFAGIKSAGGQSLENTYTVSAANQRYQHRVLEASIPLRNALLLPRDTP